MYQRSAAEKPRKDSAPFELLEGESFCIGTFGRLWNAPLPFLLVGETVVSRQPQRTDTIRYRFFLRFMGWIDAVKQ